MGPDLPEAKGLPFRALEQTMVRSEFPKSRGGTASVSRVRGSGFALTSDKALASCPVSQCPTPSALCLGEEPVLLKLGEVERTPWPPEGEEALRSELAGLGPGL